MHRLLLSLFAAFALLPAVAVPQSKVEEALADLDRALEHRRTYIGMRQAALDSLAGLRRESGDSLPLLMRLADGYTSFNNDSALVYLSYGMESANGAEALPFRWKHASLLPLAGFFEEATGEFYSIEPEGVPDSLLVSYYDSGRQMHSYMASFYGMYPDIAAEHKRRSLDYQAKLLELLPKGSSEYKFRQGEYYYLSGKPELARVILGELVDDEPADSHLRARAAHHLSSMARASGDTASYVYYLAVSATADVLSATREVLSLQELGGKNLRVGRYCPCPQLSVACSRQCRGVRRTYAYHRHLAVSANHRTCTSEPYKPMAHDGLLDNGSYGLAVGGARSHYVCAVPRDAQTSSSSGKSQGCKPCQRGIYRPISATMFHLYG